MHSLQTKERRLYLHTYVHTYVRAFFPLLSTDPNACTKEEKYSPLHFAARYMPPIIDKAVQIQQSQADTVGSATVEVGKRSSSAQTMQYLVNLKRARKVKAS